MEVTEKETRIAEAFADWLANKGFRKVNFIDQHNKILGSKWIEIWKAPQSQGEGSDLSDLFKEFIKDGGN